MIQFPLPASLGHFREGRPMPAVLNNTYCAACGGRHTLCYPDDDIIYSNRQYEYDCPANKLKVPVPHSGQSCEVRNDCPKGAIIIRKVKS